LLGHQACADVCAAAGPERHVMNHRRDGQSWALAKPTALKSRRTS
jgi:hypothetical protein